MKFDRPFLEGKNIYLRNLEEKDLAGNYFQWLNDPKVCQYNSHAIFPNTEKQMRDYLESAHASRSIVVFAIVYKKDNKHIGNISLQGINWVFRSAEFAIILGESDYWGKGLGFEAVELVVKYGFERLNLNRIYCGTSSANLAMQKIAERLGMTKEGVRRSALYKWAHYLDVYEYGILRDEFDRKGESV